MNERELCDFETDSSSVSTYISLLNFACDKLDSNFRFLHTVTHKYYAFISPVWVCDGQCLSVGVRECVTGCICFKNYFFVDSSVLVYYYGGTEGK